MIITATEYQARVLRTQGKQAIAFRQWCEQQFMLQGITSMTAFEEQSRWFELIQTEAFVNKPAVVKECIDAFKTLMLYQIPLSALNGFDQEGVVLFRGLLQRFLQKEQLSFWEAVSHLKPGTESLELFGFADFPPLYRKLLQVNPESLSLPEPILVTVYEAQSAEEEFLTALAAIEAEFKKQPQKRFALVIQQSELSWRTIHRLLKVRLSPMKISCSKGEALVDQPKFHFLQNLFESLTATDLMLISRVLTSPFWQEDWERRFSLDRALRQDLLRVSSLPEVLKYLLYKDVTLQDARWFQAWTKLANFEPKQAEAFIESFLQAAEFIDLPRSEVMSPNLYILSALEAVNFPVESIWLLSADSKHYPVAQNPSIFLPKMLLRQYGVPMSLEQITHYGAALLQAITHGKEVFASFVVSERGEKKKLSTLMTVHDHYHPDSEQHSPRRPDNAQHSSGPRTKINSIILQPEEVDTVKGGSALLKDQAECPFRAFAHFRLQATHLHYGQDLLGPMQKGLLVHSVLEKIWLSLESQQRLIELSEAERNQLISEKVDEALRQINVPARRGLIRQLEKNRLTRLIKAWLTLEMQRPAFRVLAAEVKELVTLDGLQLRLRIDRVDETETGRLVIDYKTGEVSSQGWFDERLREPQLPLYVVGNAAEGAAFASLKVGKMEFVGIVKDEAASFDRVQAISNKSWETQRSEWKQKLELLAAEFHRGHAEVKPLDEKACLYCDLGSFCRIKEQS